MEAVNDVASGRAISSFTAQWWQENSLLLTASVGMGHIKAAEAVAKELTGKDGTSPKIIDVVEYMGPLARRVYRGGYLKLAKLAPSIIGKLYDLSDSPSSPDGAARRLDSAIARRLEKHLIRCQPEIVLSTHFLTTRVVGHLKEQGKLRCGLIQVVTDFDAHALWHAPGVDHYCVGASPARDRLISFGVNPEKISITGIPLCPDFHELPSRLEAKVRLGVSASEPLVLVTLGGLGNAPYADIVRGLATAKHSFRCIVVCGRNEIARKEVEELRLSFPDLQRSRFTVEGFTDRMPLYMAASDILVGKPGGLTSSESLVAGVALVLVNPIPGQEERNADYLLEKGVATRCRYPEQLGSKIDQLLSDPEGLAHRQRTSLALGKPLADKAVAQVATEVALRTVTLRNHPKYLRTEHLLARLSAPRMAPGTAVFDLDHTILSGDIGEAVFLYLAKQGALTKLPMSTAALQSHSGAYSTVNPNAQDDLGSIYHRAIEDSKGSPESGGTTGAIYTWMNRCLAGLTIEEVQAATLKVWQENQITLRTPTLNLMESLLRIGHRIAIVSASNQISVSWVAENIINPALGSRGENAGVLPEDVWGMSNILQDGPSVRAALLLRKGSHIALTEELETPIPTFDGKAALIRTAGYGAPVLVAGDSPNDLAMMREASYVAWRPRGDAPNHSNRFLDSLLDRPKTGFCLI